MDTETSNPQAEASKVGETDIVNGVGPPKHWLQPFYSSLGELRDAGVMSALNDKSLAEELSDIGTYYEEKRNDIAGFYAPRIQNLKQTVATREGWLKAKLLEQSSLEQDLDDLKKQLNEATARIKQARAEKQLAWQRILKDRFERVRKFFKEREARIESELKQGREEILSDADSQIEYLNKFYGLILNNRNEHSEDLADRAKDCEERQNEIETQLGVAQSEARRLREFGITEYSATFLLMFGVFALAGAGSAAASLLSDRQPGSSVFAVMLENVLKSLDRLPPGWGSLAKFLVLLVAPILGIALLFGIFVGFVELAMRIAGRYDHSLTPKFIANKKSPANIEWGGAPIIKYVRGLTSPFPGTDGFAADRKTYGQMIAYFPYLMLVVIGLFLFTGIAIDGSRVNLTVIVTGMALALLSATSALLYVTYIIEPRWRAAGKQFEDENNQAAKPRRGFFFRYIRLNFEFFTLLVLLVVALLASALLPVAAPLTGWLPYFSDGQFKHISWGLLTIFMLLASFGLAYGIVQKGIFDEVRDLLRKHKIFQNCVERYRYPPLIEDLSYPERPELEDTLATFLKRQNSLEELNAAYELSHIFAPEDEAAIVPTTRTSRWPKWLRRFVRFLLAKQGQALEDTINSAVEPPMALRPIDYLDSQEAVEVYELRTLDVSEAEQAKVTTQELIVEMEKMLKELAEEIKQLTFDLEAYKSASIATEESMAATISEVNGMLRRDEIGLKKAFNVGEQLRKNLPATQVAEPRAASPPEETRSEKHLDR